MQQQIRDALESLMSTSRYRGVRHREHVDEFSRGVLVGCLMVTFVWLIMS